MKIFIMLALAAVAITAAPVAAVTINIDSQLNSGITDANAVTLSLAAGSYSVTPVIGNFTAWRRFNSNAGCNSEGIACSQGFEHSYWITIGSTSTGHGSNSGLGGAGPLPSGGYFASDVQAFNLDAASSIFTLAFPQTVKFWINDDIAADNSGGVSLNVAAAVPEPATWGLMIVGFGMAGAAARHRKTIVAS